MCRIAGSAGSSPPRHYQPGEARDAAEEPSLNWVVGDTLAHYNDHGAWIAAALRERGWR